MKPRSLASSIMRASELRLGRSSHEGPEFARVWSRSADDTQGLPRLGVNSYEEQRWRKLSIVPNRHVPDQAGIEAVGSKADKHVEASLLPPQDELPTSAVQCDGNGLDAIQAPILPLNEVGPRAAALRARALLMLRVLLALGELHGKYAGWVIPRVGPDLGLPRAGILRKAECNRELLHPPIGLPAFDLRTCLLE